MIISTLYCFIYIIYLCCLRIFETIPPRIGPLRLNIKNNPKFYTLYISILYVLFKFLLQCISITSKTLFTNLT